MNDSFTKNTLDTSQTDFSKWFNELEGYSLRSERFFEEVKGFMNEDDEFLKLAKLLEKWLKAAYEEGSKRQEALDKLRDNI